MAPISHSAQSQPQFVQMSSCLCKPGLKALRLKAGFSQNKLAREADLDRNTVSAAESGKPVQELSVSKIIQALNGKLNMELSFDDIVHS